MENFLIPSISLGIATAVIVVFKFKNYKKQKAIKAAIAKEEYKKLVESGKLRPKTSIERTIEKAHGNPENNATQAARRMAAKRGYDWKRRIR